MKNVSEILSRRNFIKVTGGAVMGMVCFGLAGCGSSQQPEAKQDSGNKSSGAAAGAGAAVGGKKILIAYFSKTGNTKKVAEAVQKSIGGDMFHIVTVKPYPEDYTETTEVAKQEQQANARPELKGKVDNMEQYDTILLGYPNWWGTMPMGVFNFIEQNKAFAGKTIVPFCTHEGSGLGRSEADLKKACPDAKLLEGLAIRGGSAGGAQADVDKWLQKIGLKK